MVILAVAVILVSGVGTSIALVMQHGQAQERQEAADERLEAARQSDAEAREAAAAEAEAREQRQAAQQARAAAERKIRGSIIRQMQASITEDARERVTEGVLDGPILYTSCDPLGGGSVDDLTALTTTFDCIAVNEEIGGGRVSGYGFASTVNWDKGSWSWQLDA